MTDQVKVLDSRPLDHSKLTGGLHPLSERQLREQAEQVGGEKVDQFSAIAQSQRS